MTQLNPYRFGGPDRGRVYVAGNTDAQVWVDLHTHRLFRSTAAGAVVQQWSGFEEMLVAETYRLAERFDERGRALPVNE